jgi:hypothetical protein
MQGDCFVVPPRNEIKNGLSWIIAVARVAICHFERLVIASVAKQSPH